MQLAALHFYLRIRLYNEMKSYIITTPTTLKKFITGKGNAKKELMLLKVYKKWGKEFDNNNICDAYSLAEYAKQQYIGSN